MKKSLFLAGLGLFFASCTTTTGHHVVVGGETFFVQEEETEDLRTGEKTYEFSVPFYGISCASLSDCRNKIEKRRKMLERKKPAPEGTPPQTSGTSASQGD